MAGSLNPRLTDIPHNRAYPTQACESNCGKLPEKLNCETTTNADANWYAATEERQEVANTVHPPFSIMLKYGCFSINKQELEFLPEALELVLSAEQPFSVNYFGQILQKQWLLDLVTHLKECQGKTISELLGVNLREILKDSEEVIEDHSQAPK